MHKHLGVQFVSGSTGAPRAAAADAGAPERRDVAARLAEAIELGAVTDLEALAQELMGGESADPALGRRIGALVQSFDFDGLRALAATLAAGGGPAAR
jgi:hypothetical protein